MKVIFKYCYNRDKKQNKKRGVKKIKKNYMKNFDLDKIQEKNEKRYKNFIEKLKKKVEEIKISFSRL
jgi:hypothetical protein